MAHKIILPLLRGWQAETGLQDEDGIEVSHLQAYLPDDEKGTDVAQIDIYAGDIPPETDAEQEAFNNYVEMFGWDENDPEDADPLTRWPFQGGDAFGFEGLCEGDAPMRLMCFEPRKGLLAVMMFIASDDDELTDIITYVEENLKID